MIFLPAHKVASTGTTRLCQEATNPLHLRQPGLPSNARIYACWPEKARAPPPNSQCRVASVATGTRRCRRLRREPRRRGRQEAVAEATAGRRQQPFPCTSDLGSRPPSRARSTCPWRCHGPSRLKVRTLFSPYSNLNPLLHILTNPSFFLDQTPERGVG
jgi:hypothetical protein